MKRKLKANLHNSMVITMLLAPCVLPQTAGAHEVPDKYKMSVLLDDASGSHMIAGEFTEAVAVIDSRGGPAADSFADNLNLCVALTMRDEFERAEPVCDKAVELSEQRVPVGSGWAPRHSTKRLNKAVALSNRGVLRALNGEPALAEDDFREARALTRRHNPAAGNLIRLMAKNDRIAGLSRENEGTFR